MRKEVIFCALVYIGICVAFYFSWVAALNVEWIQEGYYGY